MHTQAQLSSASSAFQDSFFPSVSLAPSTGPGYSQSRHTTHWFEGHCLATRSTMCGFAPCVGCPVSPDLVPSSRSRIIPMLQARKPRHSAGGWWGWDLSLDTSDTTTQFLNDRAVLKTAAFLKDKMGNEERQRFSPQAIATRAPLSSFFTEASLRCPILARILPTWFCQNPHSPHLISLDI